MGHPITTNRRSLLAYIVVWLVLSILQGFLFWYNLDFPIAVVIVDPLLSTLLFSVFGILAWYPTRYIPFQKHTPFYSILAHIMAGLLILAGYMLVSTMLLNSIFLNQEDYLVFLNSTLAWKALLGAMIYLVLVLVYYLASSAFKLQERIRQEERLRNMVREAELNMLKSQINPHFLFNSLNSISSLTMSSPEEARDMIIRLSDFLRYSLKHRENAFVPLKEELVRMKDYLAIEKVRFGDKLQYEFDLTSGCEGFPVPTMIFQPLFENAIRHSVYESTEPVMIRFSCESRQGFAKIQVTNEYDPDVPVRKGTGVGLQNVRKRIELAYNGDGSVEWKGEDGLFCVSLVLPDIKLKR